MSTIGRTQLNLLALSSSTLFLLKDPVPAFLHRLALGVSKPCPTEEAHRSWKNCSAWSEFSAMEDCHPKLGIPSAS